MSSGLAPPALFDRALIAARRARAPAGGDFVTELVLAELAERLASVNRRFARAALVGPTLSGLDVDLPMVDALELVPTLTPRHSDDMPALATGVYDLLASMLDLQAVNDVPGTLMRLRRRLKPDGLFLAVALGGASLGELRAAWIAADAGIAGGAYARVAPFMDVRDAGSLLQRAGFAMPVSDSDTHRVRYADPLRLMREIKGLGAANPMADKPRRPVTRRHLVAAMAAYPRDGDGRITATLELIWMSGWAPDDGGRGSAI
ncbi:MAG: SAM-dependent methyltransferase [Alphaproteobacteria bacterium]|nr:SAM-dependent methyltransferase [Alphaproteobacteria bacterium]